MTLEGSLQDMSLVDLFHIFRTGAKSGVLCLINGADRGVICVHQGQLIDAVLLHVPERQLSLSGEEAIIEILQWDDAQFTFRHDDAVANRPTKIIHDSEWLVLEGMRRRKKPLPVFPHQHITMESRLELAPLPNNMGGVSLDLDQWRLLSLIAVSQNMHDLCEHISMEPSKVIAMATELVLIGMIVIVPPKSRSPALRTRSTAPLGEHAMKAKMSGSASIAIAHQPMTKVGNKLLTAIMRRIHGL